MPRFEKGHTPWSKGLTKEDGFRLQNMANKISILQKGIPEKEEVKIHLSEIIRQKYIDCPNLRYEVGKSSRGKKRPEHSNFMKGSNNPAWKDGISIKERSEEFSSELKKMIKDKYRWKCSRCGKHRKDVILHIHHIDQNKKNNNINNLIPLCILCHTRLHWELINGGN